MKINIDIKEYGFESKILFQNINCEFKSGNLYIINGENGVGKSTLLSLLSFQVFDNNVNLKINDEDIPQKKYDYCFGQYVSYMTQDSLVFNDMTCIENLLFPFDNKDNEKAKKILEKLNLGSVINSKASELSEGEKQRLCFGRILYQPKEIILLDECFSFLDDENANIIVKCIEELSENKIVILVSHLEKAFNRKINCFIKDKCIQIENCKSIEKANSEYKLDNKSKVNNFMVKKNMKFFFSFLLLFLISSIGFIFGSFNNTITSYNNLLTLSMKVFESNTEILVVSKEDYESNKYSFDKDGAVKIRDAHISYLDSNSSNYSLSGLFLIDDFDLYKDELKLVSGRYPENNNECIVSSLVYKIINESNDKNYTLQYYGFDFSSIVGVYQEKDTKELDKYLKNKDEYNKGLLLRLMYGYKIETIFSLYNDNNENYIFNYGIKNNEQNRKRFDLNEAIYLCQVDSKVMLYDKNGVYIFKNFGFAEVLYGRLCLIFNVILLIVTIISFLISNYRYFLLIRTMGKSRKSLIKNVALMSGFYLSASLVLSFIISIIGLIIINCIYSSILGISLFFFNIPWLLFVIYFIVFAIIYGLFYVVLSKKILPINMKKQINDLKSK